MSGPVQDISDNTDMIMSGREPVNVPVRRTDPPTITELLHFAIERNTPVEQLERLVSLQERIMAAQAAEEFAMAMAKFQEECPVIKHNKKAKFATNAGVGVEYTYADLAQIAYVVGPYLAKCGLSFTWDMEILDNGMMMKVTCTVRHLKGHWLSSKIILPLENKNPLMSAQQKYAATQTFGERKSLAAVLGITTSSEDFDGADTDPTKITDDQRMDLEVMFDALYAGKNAERKDRGRKRFFKLMDVETFADIRAVRYKEAVSALTATE